MDEIESVLKYMDVFQDSGQDGFELTASFSIILQFGSKVNNIFISSPKGCTPMTVL